MRVAIDTPEEIRLMKPTSDLPQGSTLIWTALMTAPFLMPGARRRYGTLPVVLGALGLARELWTWVQARRAAPSTPAIASSPGLH